MRKVFLLGVLAICVAGCSTYYSGPGAAQAYSDCQLQADTLPITAQGLANPFGVAAVQQNFIQRCMANKGYQGS
jgi:hypothetical protein